jgi:small subunit ribosomal protein S6
LLHNEYETIVIIRPDVDDAVTYGLVEKFEQVITGNGGHLLHRDDWGKRKLAYPIMKQQKGHYVLLQHLAPSELVAELERRIRNEDTVMRFLTVQQAVAVDVPVRLEQVAEQKRVREEQERIRRERGEADPDGYDLDDDDTGEESDD